MRPDGSLPNLLRKSQPSTVTTPLNNSIKFIHRRFIELAVLFLRH